MQCVQTLVIEGQSFLVPDPAMSNCTGGVLLSWTEYQQTQFVPESLSAMGITSEALATDYAFGFSAVGLGFVLTFPIVVALKALKLL